MCKKSGGHLREIITQDDSGSGNINADDHEKIKQDWKKKSCDEHWNEKFREIAKLFKFRGLSTTNIYQNLWSGKHTVGQKI